MSMRNFQPLLIHFVHSFLVNAIYQSASLAFRRVDRAELHAGSRGLVAFLDPDR